jgi:hypothetical protein
VRGVELGGVLVEVDVVESGDDVLDREALKLGEGGLGRPAC